MYFLCSCPLPMAIFVRIWTWSRVLYFILEGRVPVFGNLLICCSLLMPENSKKFANDHNHCSIGRSFRTCSHSPGIYHMAWSTRSQNHIKSRRYNSNPLYLTKPFLGIKACTSSFRLPLQAVSWRYPYIFIAKFAFSQGIRQSFPPLILLFPYYRGSPRIGSSVDPTNSAQFPSPEQSEICVDISQQMSVITFRAITTVAIRFPVSRDGRLVLSHQVTISIDELFQQLMDYPFR